ncbi:MAG: hypothetical protein A2275_08675 [Bacteroidetes bacterium RIFOXYA12_FULL_35_11]|nr:MAG: hypothetical protein A2X01_16795 [Bacteroidetes bacterium GWF2_35_48]OFY82877.1 MAG: hypothetical protein A2275_08675 [Bacteroidetes bacterium RIFOXYA12_FULL_35_11]HBX53571.1 hypothetical protein [Bacteroidales bacterium]
MKKLFGIIVVLLIFVNFSYSQDANSFLESGKNKFKNRDYKGAVEDFTKAIELDPNDMNFYLQRGYAYGLIDNYESAITDYTTIIKKEPKHTFAYISRGAAYNKLKKYEKALNDLSKAIELDPSNTEAYNNRGWAKKFMGDKKGACKDWKESKKKGNDEAKIIMKNNGC